MGKITDKQEAEMSLTLDVAVSTHGKDGILKVEKMLLPPQDGVRYVISWQEHKDAPVPDSLSGRRDVEVWRLEEKGLSNNRNNAIAHCKSDIVLIADDDLVYKADGFRVVMKAFESDPDLDLATFRAKYSHPKTYPEDRSILGTPLPKGYFVASIEIAFRRDRLSGLYFNPRLGLGSGEMLCGEEEIFLHEAIQSGKICRHIADVVCEHPHPTTGTKVTAGVLMGQGYVIRRLYGVTAFPRIFLKAWRVSKAFSVSFPKTLWHLLRGAFKKI